MKDLIPYNKQDLIKADIEEHKAKCASVVITDELSAQGASELLAIVQKKAKKIKEMRLEATKEAREAVAKTNDWFMVYEKGFEEMAGSLKTVVGAWLRKQEEIARAKQAEAEEAERKRLAEAEKAGTPVEEKTELTPVTEKPKTNIQTQSGLVGTTKRWTYEVVDPSKVPDEYKIVDTAGITKAVRMGVRVIPGVRIYQDFNVSVR